MINTDYSSIYGQYLNAVNSSKAKGKTTDRSTLSKNMEYLEAAKTKAEEMKGTSEKNEIDSTDKVSDSKKCTQEDLQKLYAELSGMHYNSYDGKDSMRQMANSFLNQMVFSHMGSSKSLFVPQMSHNVLAAAFNAAYDYSDMEDQIRQSGEQETSEKTDVYQSVDSE